MTKSKPRKTKSKPDALEDFEQAMRALLIEARKLGVDGKLRSKLETLAEAAVNLAETAEAEQPNAPLEEWRDDRHLLGKEDPAKRKARHDAGYIDANHELVSGRLYSTEVDAPMATDEERAVIRAVIDAMRQWLGYGVGYSADDRRRVEGLYETLYGHPAGEPWRSTLAGVLHEELLVRRQRQLGGEGLREPWTGHELLLRLRERMAGEAVPGWVTAERLADVVPRLNLGGKGGRGKLGTPKQAVAKLARDRGGNSKG